MDRDIKITRLILDHCTPQTLSRCARVCFMWHYEAVKRLWRGSFKDDKWITPSLEDIERTYMSAERLQYYLQHVIYYKLWMRLPMPSAGPDWRSLLAAGKLTAPYARSLEVSIKPNLLSQRTVEPLLVRTLLSIRLIGGSFCDGFLRVLWTWCPNLRAVALLKALRNSDSPALVRFVETLHQIESFELQSSQRTIDQNFLSALLSRPNLKSLSLMETGSLESGTLMRLMVSGWLPIALSLRNLEIPVVDERAVRALLPRLTNLQAVTVSMVEHLGSPGETVLAPLCNCSRLQEVVLNIPPTAVVRLAELGAMAESCSSLRKLHINVYSGTSVMDYDWYEWTNLTKHLKMMEDLTLETRIDVDIDGFVQFAHDCPRLIKLNLFASVDVEELDEFDRTLTFVSVQSLRLACAAPFFEARSRAEARVMAIDAAHALCDRMPRLLSFLGNNLGPQSQLSVLGHATLRKAVFDRGWYEIHGIELSKSIKHILLEELFSSS